MDNDRFLWMTTEEGLVRFDGRNFKVYNQNNHPGINNDRFRFILRTLDNQLVVSELSGSAFLLKNGNAKQIRNGNITNPIKYHVKGIIPDTSFYLKSLFRKFDFIADSELPLTSVYIIELPGKSHGVFLNNGKLLRIFNGKRIFRDIRIPQEQPNNFFTLNGSPYFFDKHKNLFHINTRTQEISSVRVSGSLSNPDFNSIFLTDNLIWNPVYKEVYYKKDNTLYKLDSPANPLLLFSSVITTQLPSNCKILDVLLDEKSQSYFIGTDTKGFYIFKNNKLKTFVLDSGTGVQSNAFYSQCEIDSNTAFAGTNFEFTIDGGKKSKLPVLNTGQECLIRDEQNRIYFAKYNILTYYDLTNGTSASIPTIPIAEYYSFEKDGDSILVGSSEGIGILKNLKYTQIYFHKRPIPNHRIEFLKRGPDGKIWVAMCKGVEQLDTKTGKMNVVAGLDNICTRVLFRDGDKMLVGTYGNGFYIWQNGKVVKMPFDKNQYLSHVHSFFIDKKNYLWMSTNNGLFRTHYNNILNFLKDQNYKISYEYFGNDDGILNTEFNGGCTPPYILLKNGYLSYPSMEGLVWLKPEDVPDSDPSENILIDELIVDRIKFPLDSNFMIPSDHEMIEIHFATPYWGNEENLNLEYKLEGLNSSWTPINPKEDRLRFSNLSSGSYRFLIRKEYKSGENSYLESEMHFYVEKKFYETTGFILLAVTLGACLIYLLMILNSRRIIRENLELEKKITDRTNELKDVNIQLQENFRQLAVQENFLRESISVKNQLISIISHDIITPLKFISMVSRISKRNPEILNKDKLVESMKDIEFASDKLYNNASNILNWMKFQNNRIVPKMDHIALHDFIHEITEPLLGMAEAKEIAIVNHVPEEDIIVSDRTLLMIILQNIISNAIKYTNNGKVTVSTSEGGKYYLITVADNGIGMSAEVKKMVNNIIYHKMQLTSVQADKKETGNQLGYFIITDFLHLLSGTIEVESNPGIGTSVTIGIPH